VSAELSSLLTTPSLTRCHVEMQPWKLLPIIQHHVKLCRSPVWDTRPSITPWTSFRLKPLCTGTQSRTCGNAAKTSSSACTERLRHTLHLILTNLCGTRWVLRKRRLYFRPFIENEEGLSAKQEILCFLKAHTEMTHEWTVICSIVMNEKTAFVKRKQLVMNNLNLH